MKMHVNRMMVVHKLYLLLPVGGGMSATPKGYADVFRLGP